MRYHFNLRNGFEVFLDDVGLDLPSDDHARIEALVTLREIQASGAIPEELFDGWCLEVLSPGGQVILVLPFVQVGEMAAARSACGAGMHH